MTRKNRIMIYGPKDDGTYLVEFRTAEGDVLAISIPRTESAVLRHFQDLSWPRRAADAARPRRRGDRITFSPEWLHVCIAHTFGSVRHGPRERPFAKRPPYSCGAHHLQFWITTLGKLVGNPTILFYRSDIKRKFSIVGSPGRIRTSDQPVNSRLLYR
jgi:hypothetical protein